MAFTLVIYPGTSSKKYALYEGERLRVVKQFERDQTGCTVCSITHQGRGQCLPIEPEVFQVPLRRVVDDLFKEGEIKNLYDIEQVGIRVVAPGTTFQQHAYITDVYLHDLRTQEAIAPLYIPPILTEIEASLRELPKAKLVAVSDSAFHATMPDCARRYSIDHADAERHDVYRFGYYGLSVASVVRRMKTTLGGIPPRTIVCHVGSGVSVTALRNGQSVDTSTSFNPNSGLMMSAQAGDLDTGALLELMRVKNMRVFDAHTYLNTRGGLQGVAGDADLRHVLDGVTRHNEAAVRALNLFVYHLQKQIGSYLAVLGGLDALVFTATAVERNPAIRALIVEPLQQLGMVLHQETNERLIGNEGVISTADSPTTIAVVKNDELAEIAQVAQSFSVPPQPPRDISTMS